MVVSGYMVSQTSKGMDEMTREQAFTTAFHNLHIAQAGCKWYERQGTDCPIIRAAVEAFHPLNK